MDFGRRALTGLVAGAVLAACAALPLLAEGLTQSPRPMPRPSLPGTEAPAAAPLSAPEASPESSPKRKAAPKRNPNIGAVTNLPIPRYVTLKGREGFARRGPSKTHRIDWVFTTAGTPLRVTAEHDVWRRVEDYEGFGGWVHFTLLSGVRGAIITQDMAEFHALPDPAAPVVFQAEAGALGRVLTCNPAWCRLRADGRRGWVQKSAIWGVGADEILE